MRVGLWDTVFSERLALVVKSMNFVLETDLPLISCVALGKLFKLNFSFFITKIRVTIVAMIINGINIKHLVLLLVST